MTTSSLYLDTDTLQCALRVRLGQQYAFFNVPGSLNYPDDFHISAFVRCPDRLGPGQGGVLIGYTGQPTVNLKTSKKTNQNNLMIQWFNQIVKTNQSYPMIQWFNQIVKTNQSYPMIQWFNQIVKTNQNNPMIQSLKNNQNNSMTKSDN